MAAQFRQIFLFLFFFLFLLVVFALPMSAQSVPASQPSIDYTLPYPGLLPDNPLYVFKAIRDKLVSIFIADPKSKAEFDLLQADKRLAASFSLSKERPINGQLVVGTLSKGENYFSEALGQASVAKRQGIEINGLLDQMENATKKHLQIISGIEHSLSQKDSEQLASEANRVREFVAQVKKLRSQQ